jgi:hypothetical protein
MDSTWAFLCMYIVGKVEYMGGQEFSFPGLVVAFGLHITRLVALLALEGELREGN